MGKIEEILKSKEKPKQKLTILAKILTEEKSAMNDLINYFDKVSDSEKGYLMEALEYVTKENPEIGKYSLDFVIKNINYKAPRVKWEASRIVGNVARKYPDKIKEVIPKLLENTKDKGTVVRWSAAFALTEIAKSNPELQEELALQFNEIVKKETNNGVKNIYLKYLKSVEK
ncbi:MAG: HEAT repeat domain-containing protein [Candidatus Thermoplasmatota archaeon]